MSAARRADAAALAPFGERPAPAYPRARPAGRRGLAALRRGAAALAAVAGLGLSACPGDRRPPEPPPRPEPAATDAGAGAVDGRRGDPTGPLEPGTPAAEPASRTPGASTGRDP